MPRRIALIGFGEAAQAFAGAVGWVGAARAYDKLTDDPASRLEKLAQCAALGVLPAETPADALDGAELVLSLVTAGEALAAAEATARHMPRNALYCDMNSVSPDTKRLAARAIERAGATYVDVAIMSPVNPGRLAVPLLLSGRGALEAERALRETGFENPRTVGPRVGSAAAIKMIRSVVVKGIEALTAEAMMAAAEAGVVNEVIASLDASEQRNGWSERADYYLERMLIHGTRRSEEMDEVVRALESLGVEPTLSRGTARRQRELGSRLIHPEAGLEAKIAQLLVRKADAA